MADMIITPLESCRAFSQYLVTGDTGDTITFPAARDMRAAMDDPDGSGVAGPWADNPDVRRARVRVRAALLGGAVELTYDGFAPYTHTQAEVDADPTVLGSNPWGAPHRWVAPDAALTIRCLTDGVQWYCISPMSHQSAQRRIVRQTSMIDVGPGGAFAVSIGGPARFDGVNAAKFNVRRTRQPQLDVELQPGGLAIVIWKDQDELGDG